MYKHILVPTDGSPLSLKAAKAAAGLAKRLGAKVTAVYVIPQYVPDSADDSAVLYRPGHTLAQHQKACRKFAEAALDKVARSIAAAKVPCERLAVDNDAPWHGIISAAKSSKCDLIVMASHGRRGLAGLLIGSETNKVLTHSQTPVLVCR